MKRQSEFKKSILFKMIYKVKIIIIIYMKKVFYLAVK